MNEDELKHAEAIVELATKFSDEMIESQHNFLKHVSQILGNEISSKIILMPMLISAGNVLFALKKKNKNKSRIIFEFVAHLKDYLEHRENYFNNKDKH